MSIEGVDYSWERPTRAQLDTAGAQFCVRYLLDASRDRGKALSRQEALTLNSWGRFVVSNFEYEVGGPKRGFNQGVADARTSLAEILEIGIPRNVVYFSVDWDMQDSEWPAVLAYLNGASSVLGKANVGVYGSYRTVSKAYTAGYRWLWQTYAWSNGRWHPNATIHQYRNHAFPDWDGDKCRAMVADYGQWSLTGMESEMELTDKIVYDSDTGTLTNGYLTGDDTVERVFEIIAIHAVNGNRTAGDAKSAANAAADNAVDAKDIASQALAKVQELIDRPTAHMPTAAEIAAELIRQLSPSA